MALLPFSPDHTRVTNMLAPRTPGEAAASEAEAVVQATEVKEAAAVEPAPTSEAVVQATEVKGTTAVEPAPAAEAVMVAEPATAESTQQETPSASTASAPDVAQPEGKSKTDDMEAAKA